jgi:serine/threonine-protein kinase HipA
MNLLGETDGSSDQHSYLDLVGLIESLGDSVDKDLQQLWRRLVFSICISNTDDHLRNHGFLLSGSYWNLSPAYDLNPVPDQAWLSLAVDFDDPSRDLRHALDVADYFRLTSSQAENIAGQIQETIKKHWPLLADKYHIAKNEQSRMSPAFSECERILS